ncbi:phosphoribosylformylglycinamidine synthase subunit PurL [Halorubrum ezzemoulense]|uniref:Phosphoribosylformylglycinamidine synthase subunit PurL n=1 Tax=Halorubrum ezzemoulense TaxID=337243 RepID=A0A256JUI2_HALEZ|nr:MULTISPECIES: phosphoribosylformylglycinamidine synthase subunit PurL [Halorubrum]MDB2244998.1 phosphoribosylformylglycinamidine synthase subunit PurL [Halorubrum ezzemoulense]MDB2251205.1 phosphoribosylformylglycinamidine synthase subunit PurL [Halorubrum ezzemoulense]MDB2278245.1 phosphoribosylformylglycinamidine synthase subunit PurL [Halorubrum ezzemoulense]MDB2284919.1 phosphoribosylformylglycinamidine synthase subunit PurL [Halorubrum ezzemoulense]MDB2288333.1 phosphoribosylformylglyc
MSLSDADHELVTAELGREPTAAEAALFENLWSEHCAYRSSRPLLSAFDSEGDQVVVGPGDDAAVLALPEPDAADDPAAERDADDYGDTYVTFGVESHNHPSFVDPFDGAATGVGGIVRDTMSMGAYPIGLLDSLYFGGFDRERSRYLFEGVVEGISHYGNCIGVPTVGGSVAFHGGYEGNPLVNVACVGLTNEDRLVTATAQEPGNKLVLVGNGTGRDGLGGASFASEDLAEDAETEDRPAVQVGDPYAEKRLIECNEALIDEDLVRSARDLGAAGLGGASSELVAKGGLGARIDLDAVHQREPNMNATEILLAESQERMCYEVAPDDVERVADLAERFDLGCSVIGEVTDGNYVCEFAGGADGEGGADADGATDRDPETVVDAPAEFLADGAPMNDLESEPPSEPDRDLPADEPSLDEAVAAVLSAPSTASKRWVYRQYDHEVGTRTAVKPGDDAALLAVRETEPTDEASETAASADGVGLALASGANPKWTAVAPYEGARAVALENATNLAATGAVPLAAVDCLNGGNPEKPDVYGAFEGIVDGLADACAALDAPVVGGNVSLYNDSVEGPIPPTPTLAVLGTRRGYDAPPAALDADRAADSVLLLVGSGGDALGGSEYLAHAGGGDRFPTLPDESGAADDLGGLVASLAAAARHESTLAAHDVSEGGLAVALAELVTDDAGVDATLPDRVAAFDETPGRLLVQTTEPEAVAAAVGDLPVFRLGDVTTDGALSLTVGDESVALSAAAVRDHRDVIERELA